MGAGKSKIKVHETHLDITEFEKNDLIEFDTELELSLSHYQIFQDKMEGLKLWEGAIVMVRYLIRYWPDFAGKSLLDVGAGMGVVGIAAAAFLECDVLMVDYLEPVIELCQKNIETNMDMYAADRVPKVQFLDWNKPDNFDFDQTYEIIIGCELVYSITNSEKLVSFLSKTLKKDSELLLIIPTCRAYGPDFMAALNKISANLHIEETILEDAPDEQFYKKQPVKNAKKDEFFPLQELNFKLLRIYHKGPNGELKPRCEPTPFPEAEDEIDGQNDGEKEDTEREGMEEASPTGDQLAQKAQPDEKSMNHSPSKRIKDTSPLRLTRVSSKPDPEAAAEDKHALPKQPSSELESQETVPSAPKETQGS